MAFWIKIKARAKAWIDDGETGLPKKIIRGVQLAIILLASLLLAAWAIAPLRTWLESKGIFSEHAVTGALGIAVIFTLYTLDELFMRIKRIDETLVNLALSKSTIIKGGIGRVYGPLLDELQKVPEKQRSIDVLGLTLFSAWNSLEGWLDDRATQRWKVRLLCLSPQFGKPGVPGIPNDWSNLASTFVQRATKYITDHEDDLSRREIEIQLENYSAFPAIHGFLIGNGTLFLSYTHWDGDNLAQPYQPYERFDATDHSDRAEFYRCLFSNWFDHAQRTASHNPVASKKG